MVRDLQLSLSAGAKVQYERTWYKFAGFITSVIGACALPATPHNTGLYITHLRRSGLRSTTMKSHLSVISFFHKLHGLESPTNAFVVTKLLDGYSKREPPAKQRGPITLSTLTKLVRATTLCSLSKYNTRLYASIFTLMYHAALRASEICIMPSCSHTLQSSQIEVLSHSKGTQLRVTFHTFKHSRGPQVPFLIHPCAGGAMRCTPIQEIPEGAGPRRRSSLPVHRWNTTPETPLGVSTQGLLGPLRH